MPQVEALATAGALGCFGLSRRRRCGRPAAATQRPDGCPASGRRRASRRCRE
ncbi:hypothetical protein I553_0488 [Mycobacterium xenopi 4042]|uniref:Uncharacterized protein n=1 Tax=Mycobacterium xenopi 4042 TaxID=1299334 RepID=X7YJ29_MYCXE|nr:hypothetical protein I553_0488 [Mycobacterium xenopi 4042]